MKIVWEDDEDKYVDAPAWSFRFKELVLVLGASRKTVRAFLKKHLSKIGKPTGHTYSCGQVKKTFELWGWPMITLTLYELLKKNQKNL